MMVFLIGVLLCVGGRGATGDPFKSVLLMLFLFVRKYESYL